MYFGGSEVFVEVHLTSYLFSKFRSEFETTALHDNIYVVVVPCKEEIRWDRYPYTPPYIAGSSNGRMSGS